MTGHHEITDAILPLYGNTGGVPDSTAFSALGLLTPDIGSGSGDGV